FLTRFASEVTIIHRRDELRATPIVQTEAFENPKIKFQWNSVVTSLHGDPILQQIEVENVKTKEHSMLDADGIFVYIGSTPNTDFVKIDGIEKDEGGYFHVDKDMNVGIPGVFATGDVRAYPLRQISISSANGSIAALMAEKHIGELKREKKYLGTI
ncbi:MAG: NAD(P)/FAD-dependent oxidoreductase, partial [bacterium]